jgi:hypothetical protein
MSPAPVGVKTTGPAACVLGTIQKVKRCAGGTRIRGQAGFCPYLNICNPEAWDSLIWINSEPDIQ